MNCSICGEETSQDLIDRETGACLVCDRLDRRGMPSRYLKAKKSDFSDEYQGYFDSNESLFIYGNVGSGKTWLMSCLMREQMKTSVRPPERGQIARRHDDSLFVSLPELMLKIRGSMNRDSELTEEGIISKYSKVGSLFLDDIGAENTTEYSRSSLFVLIERRNTMDKGRTVITSNLSLKELASNHGPRIASRIAEMCRIIKMPGIDLRLKKEKQ